MIGQDIDLVNFRKLLAEYFNRDELKTLCFDLGVEYENLEGETLDGKTREIIKYCYKRGLLDELIEQCREARPNIDWQGVNKNEDSDEKSLDSANLVKAFFQLTKDFNRNRHKTFSNLRTMEGDEIAFQMREMAPQLFDLFDVSHWLNNRSQGKRLAAVSYLSWSQDVEYFENLVERLFVERPFLQMHILVAINSMVDQLDYNYVRYLKTKLENFDAKGDGPIEYWKERILSALRTYQG